MFKTTLRCLSCAGLLLGCGDDSPAPTDTDGTTGMESTTSSTTAPPTATASTSGTTTDDTTGMPTTEGESSTGEPPIVVPIELTIRENPDMTISMFGDVEIDGATDLVVTISRDGEELFGRPGEDNDGTHTAFLWGLTAETDYTAVAEVDLGPGMIGRSDEVAFTTGVLPEGMAEFELVRNLDGAHEGPIIFPMPAPTLEAFVGVNPEGEVIWYHVVPVRTGDVRQGADGRLTLTTREGIRIIEPWGEVITDIPIAPYHHEIQPLPNGNYLVLTDRVVPIDVAVLGGVVDVIDDGLQEIDPDGNIITEWWGSEHLDTQYYPGPLSMGGAVGADPPPHDWTHGNAVAYDPDRNLALLSARHLHWLVAIEWPSGDVAWRLGNNGDFTFDGPPEDWFYATHAPEFGEDNTILVYDNGLERPGDTGLPISRAAYFSYDDVAMTASLEWAAEIQPQTPIFGDADRLPNGNVLAVAGGILAPFPPPRIIEFTADADPQNVWEMNIVGGGVIYRATHLETF